MFSLPFPCAFLKLSLHLSFLTLFAFFVSFLSF
jgi:hypothetical protein